NFTQPSRSGEERHHHSHLCTNAAAPIKPRTEILNDLLDGWRGRILSDVNGPSRRRAPYQFSQSRSVFFAEQRSPFGPRNVDAELLSRLPCSNGAPQLDSPQHAGALRGVGEGSQVRHEEVLRRRALRKPDENRSRTFRRQRTRHREECALPCLISV